MVMRYVGCISILDQALNAVLEVCGFNDWLIRMLQVYRCHKVILIQPEHRKKRKPRRIPNP
jgi:hypothetical protein